MRPTDRTVDYLTEDFSANDHRYDLVLDAVGKSSFGACRRLLKPRGVYLSSELGPYGQNIVLASRLRWMRGRRTLFAFPRDAQATARRVGSS